MSLTRPCLGPRSGERCPYGAFTTSTRCPDCRRANWRERPSPSQRGHGREYERVKAYVLARDGYMCRLRLPGCTVNATTADYLVPWSRGGTIEPSNLVAACVHCNSVKSDRLVAPR